MNRKEHFTNFQVYENMIFTIYNSFKKGNIQRRRDHHAKIKMLQWYSKIDHVSRQINKNSELGIFLRYPTTRLEEWIEECKQMIHAELERRKIKDEWIQNVTELKTKNTLNSLMSSRAEVSS